MAEYKIKPGDPLRAALGELEPGDVLSVPYKAYSAATIRSTIYQVRVETGLDFKSDCSGNTGAKITRLK